MPNTPIDQQIWNAIRDRIVAAQASGQLLEYVKTDSFYQGLSEVIPNGAFPAILMEPEGEDETNHSMPDGLRHTFRISIYCIVEDFVLKDQIVGDGTKRGVLDMANDVKNVVTGTDPKLGLASIAGQGGVLRVRFPTTQFLVDNFPMREAVITTEVEYITRLNTR